MSVPLHLNIVLMSVNAEIELSNSTAPEADLVVHDTLATV